MVNRMAIILSLLTVGFNIHNAQGAETKQKIIGMYVHQHWAYNHPYAARTWSLEDWHGYLDGLHRIGYNSVMIWPVLETIPNPLTDSDRANLERISKVIDMIHDEFDMKAFIVMCPNVSAKDEEAQKYAFEKRPFFFCDYRVNPGDSEAMQKMLTRREELLRPLSKMDMLVVIDSDPGGYPGSTNQEYVNLLLEHRKMLDRLRPGIELTYWMHAGWEAYCRFYSTGEFTMGPDEETLEVVRMFADANPEPWGLTGGRSSAAEASGFGDRMFPFPYGAIEGEPSFPMTNFGDKVAYNTGHSSGPRGIMGNAQTHCIQLPNTFAFARGAQGAPCERADYVQFANDLLPGHGEAIVEAWSALSGTDITAMRDAETKLTDLSKKDLTTGPLKGLLFGDPKRFLCDIVMQLRLRATLEDFHSSVFAEKPDSTIVASRLGEFVNAASEWQNTHGYKNNWWWPRMEEALQKLSDPGIEAAFAKRNYKGEGSTPFEQVQNGFKLVETYTPGVISAMKNALDTMRLNPRCGK